MKNIGIYSFFMLSLFCWHNFTHGAAFQSAEQLAQQITAIRSSAIERAHTSIEQLAERKAFIQEHATDAEKAALIEKADAIIKRANLLKNAIDHALSIQAMQQSQAQLTALIPLLEHEMPAALAEQWQQRQMPPISAQEAESRLERMLTLEEIASKGRLQLTPASAASLQDELLYFQTAGMRFPEMQAALRAFNQSQAASSGQTTIAAQEKEDYIRLALQQKQIPTTERERLIASILANAEQANTTQQLDHIITFLVEQHQFEQENKAKNIITKPIASDMCLSSRIPVTDVSGQVKKQTTLTCGYHAIWNAAQIFSYLKNEQDIDAANKALAEGQDIKLWKSILEEKGREVENIDDEDVTYLATQVQGLNPQDVTIIPSIYDFTPAQDEDFWQAAKNLQTEPGFVHMFLVGTARHVAQSGGAIGRVSGHWTAMVAQNDNGIMRLHVADSLYSARGEFSNKDVIKRLQEWLTIPWQTLEIFTTIEPALETARESFIQKGNVAKAIKRLQTIATQTIEQNVRDNHFYIKVLTPRIRDLLTLIRDSVDAFTPEEDRAATRAQLDELFASFGISATPAASSACILSLSFSVRPSSCNS